METHIPMPRAVPSDAPTAAMRMPRTAPLSEHATSALPASALLAMADVPRTPRSGSVGGPRPGERARRAAAFPFRRRRIGLAGAQALLDRLRPGSTIHLTSAGLTISHPAGLTTLVRPRPVTADQLPSPADLLACGPTVAVQALFQANPGRPVHTCLTVHTGVSSGDPRLAQHRTLNQVRAQLDRAGMAADPETEPAAVNAMAHIAGGYVTAQETWRFWRVGAVSQACFRVDGTPHGQLVANLLGRTPGVAVTVAWNVHAQHQSLVLRLAAPSDGAVDQAAQALGALIGPARLVRMDGAHRLGLAATLPIGAFPR